MTHILTAVTNPDKEKITEQTLDALRSHIENVGGNIGDVKCLRNGIAYDIAIETPVDITNIRDTFNKQHLDIAQFQDKNRRKKILISDMDATVLQMETLDYMCHLLGIGEQVEEITNRGMRGEIDFEQSLTERVALMTGMSTHVMDELLNNLDYTAGVKTTIATLVRDNVQCALVSGGFTFTTAVVADEMGFQHHHANTLGVHGDTFTGTLIGQLSGPTTKGEILQSMMQKYSVSASETCAIGDGANDIPMIEMADMGIAFYGKPKVRQASDIQINVTDYDTILYYMGYHVDEFVE